MKYNPKIVVAYFKEMGIPEPMIEYPFCPGRKFRFDFAWMPNGQGGVYLSNRVALEVQGGIFRQGRHTQGAALLKEWEKLNAAACIGWRILYCQPEDVCMKETADMIKRALNL